MSAEVLHELPMNVEQAKPIQDWQTRAIDVLANNPARAVTYLLLAQKPATLSDLANTVRMAQHSLPGHLTHHDAYSAQAHFLKSTLLPSGLVQPVEGTNPRVYSVNDEAAADAIDIAVAASDWQLQFPHISIKTLLGESRFSSSPGMPTLRLNIYEKLLQSAHGYVSSLDLRATKDQPIDNLPRTLRKMESEGIIEHRSKRNRSQRTLQLLNPDPQKIQLYRSRMLPATALLYEHVSSLYASGLREVSGQWLLDSFISKHQEANPQEIWEIIVRDPPLCITFTDKEMYSDDKAAHIQLREEVRPAIADLVLRYRLLREDPSFRQAAKLRADEILNSPQDLITLISKGGRQSQLEKISSSTDMHRKLGSLTLQRLPVSRSWRDKAICDERDQDLLFPLSTKDPNSEEVQEAKSLCDICPVRGDCLQWSLDTGQDAGVYGGMTPKERRAYLRKPRVPDAQFHDPNALTNNDISLRIDEAILAARRKEEEFKEKDKAKRKRLNIDINQ